MVQGAVLYRIVRRFSVSRVGRFSLKHHLLIANRDAQLCELYQRFLTELGYEVETAADGLECLAKLRQAPPAVLVLDQELLWGGSDGVLAWLHEESPAIPVLLMAATTARPDRHEFKEPPVVDYLPKPVALTPLLDSVRFAVAGRERSKEAVERRSRFSLRRAFHFLGD